MTEHEPLLPLSASQREALEEAVSRYAEAVMEDQEVAAYLQGRGIEWETASTFRLGVVDDPYPGHERYVGMLAIPYLGTGDRPLTVRFRCLKAHDHRENYHGKYNTMKDDPSRIFNVRAVIQAGAEISVTEGEMDAMILNQIGIPAVAIPGADAWKTHYRRVLAGFSQVYVWGDPDQAGGEFISRLTRAMPQARAVLLDKHIGDINETYLAQGADALYALIGSEAA